MNDIQQFAEAGQNVQIYGLKIILGKMLYVFQMAEMNLWKSPKSPLDGKVNRKNLLGFAHHYCDQSSCLASALSEC